MFITSHNFFRKPLYVVPKVVPKTIQNVFHRSVPTLMSFLDAATVTLQGPMCAMRTPLLSKQAAVTSSHSLP